MDSEEAMSGRLDSGTMHLSHQNTGSARSQSMGNDTALFLNSQQATATQNAYQGRDNLFNSFNTVSRVADTTAEQLQLEFEDFLIRFKDPETGNNCYLDQIKSFRRLGITTLYIDFEHVMLWDEVMAKTIATQFYRMDVHLRKLLQNMVRRYDSSYLNAKVGSVFVEKENLKEFWIGWCGLPNIMKLRDIRSADLGKLTAITGTVTRTSEVRPEILHGTFRCEECFSIIKDVEQEFKYTEPVTCLKTTCNNRTNFRILVDRSKFVDWQKIRVQENPDEIPSGSMPRTVDVILRNECVERAKAGDKIVITGMPIVVPDIVSLVGNTQIQSYDERGRSREGFSMEGVTGLRELGVRDLTYRVVFLGSLVQPAQAQSTLASLRESHNLFEEVSEEVILNEFTEEEMRQIQEMRQDRLLYQKLVSSIAPHIFGHDNVKKGILLQLLGGVQKKTPEKINLRGDINVCIVGDPSTAKSQFLSYVAKMIPNAVYTSGKASSAAGLTASVVRDEETGEFSIEAGALMLADNGICCIDEFDKMDLKDHIAIHEAMEQQTISITKAGIQATLNAKTSVLAAANPIYGRYDKKLTLKQNVNLSSSLMSRFDVFFAVIDECNEVTDWNIARHIVNFHRQLGETNAEYTTEQLIRYIKYAKTFKPKMMQDAMKCLAEQYRNIRQGDCTSLRALSSRITVRQLESMIRLSEALAKLHASNEVKVDYVKEAAHILKTSIVYVEQSNIDIEYTEDLAAKEDKEQTQEKGPKVKIKVSAEEYNKIVQMLLLKLSNANRNSENEDSSNGMRKSELVEWYIETLEENELLESEKSVMHQIKLVRCVIDRLVKKENVLLELQEQLAQSDDQMEGILTNDPILILHPNFVMDA